MSDTENTTPSTLPPTDLEKELGTAPASTPTPTEKKGKKPKAEAPAPAPTPEGPKVTEVPGLGYSTMEPFALYIHGLDKQPEGLDPDFLRAFDDQERVDYPVDENLLASIKEQGVLNPVRVQVVKAEGDTYVFAVMNGRQRVKAARKLGKTSIPVIGETGRDADSIALYVVESNELRIYDPILVKCAKAAALAARGIKQRRIAVAFGENQSTISNWVKLHNASDYLKKLVADETVAWTTAVKMAAWSDDKIRAAVEQARDTGEGSDGDDTGEGSDGDDTGEGSGETKPKKVTANSLFGDFKATLLAVLEDFKLPDTYGNPTEAFIIGATLGVTKKFDDVPEDLKKLLNGKMSRKAKHLAKKASGSGSGEE